MISPRFKKLIKKMNATGEKVRMRAKQANRSMFTQQEDAKLISLVQRHQENWKKISKEMNNRSVRQCKERYNHYLSPTINHSEWTKQEDDLLLSKVDEHGKRWKLFEVFFDGRTEIDIRNRFNVLMRRKAKIDRIKQKRLKPQVNQLVKNFYLPENSLSAIDTICLNLNAPHPQNTEMNINHAKCIQQNDGTLDSDYSIFNLTPDSDIKQAIDQFESVFENQPGFFFNNGIDLMSVYQDLEF